MKYNENDYKLLHDKINVVEHVKSDKTLCFNPATKRLKYPMIDYFKGDFDYAVKFIIELLGSNKEEIEFLEKVAFEYSIDDIPLLLRREDNVRLVAEWRAEIGK